MRRRQAQQPVKIELPRRGGEQVGSPHHLGDTHPGVVHHDGQLVSKHAVGTAEVEVAAVVQEILGVDAHTAVGEGDILVRNHETVGRSLLFPLLSDLRRCQTPAGAGVDDIAVRGVGRAGCVELAAGAEAGIDEAHGLELPVALGVDAAALALVIGRVRPAPAAALVPDKAQPCEILFQLVGVPAGAALCVQVLDAEDDAPALTLRAQPCKEAARQIPQMQPPAGAGSEPPY